MPLDIIAQVTGAPNPRWTHRLHASSSRPVLVPEKKPMHAWWRTLVPVAPGADIDVKLPPAPPNTRGGPGPLPPLRNRSEHLQLACQTSREQHNWMQRWKKLRAPNPPRPQRDLASEKEMRSVTEKCERGWYRPETPDKPQEKPDWTKSLRGRVNTDGDPASWQDRRCLRLRKDWNMRQIVSKQRMIRQEFDLQNPGSQLLPVPKLGQIQIQQIDQPTSPDPPSLLDDHGKLGMVRQTSTEEDDFEEAMRLASKVSEHEEVLASPARSRGRNSVSRGSEQRLSRAASAPGSKSATPRADSSDELQIPEDKCANCERLFSSNEFMYCWGCGLKKPIAGTEESVSHDVWQAWMSDYSLQELDVLVKFYHRLQRTKSGMRLADDTILTRKTMHFLGIPMNDPVVGRKLAEGLAQFYLQARENGEYHHGTKRATAVLIAATAKMSRGPIVPARLVEEDDEDENEDDYDASLNKFETVWHFLDLIHKAIWTMRDHYAQLLWPADQMTHVKTVFDVSCGIKGDLPVQKLFEVMNKFKYNFVDTKSTAQQQKLSNFTKKRCAAAAVPASPRSSAQGGGKPPGGVSLSEMYAILHDIKQDDDTQKRLKVVESIREVVSRGRLTFMETLVLVELYREFLKCNFEDGLPIITCKDALEALAQLLEACTGSKLDGSAMSALREIVFENYPDVVNVGDRVSEKGRVGIYGIVTEVSSDRQWVKVNMDESDTEKKFNYNQVVLALPVIFQKGDPVLVKKSAALKINAEVIAHDSDSGKVQVRFQDTSSQLCAVTELELQPRMQPAPSLSIFASIFDEIMRNSIGNLSRDSLQVEKGWNSFAAVVIGEELDDALSMDFSDPNTRVSRRILQKQRGSMVNDSLAGSITSTTSGIGSQGLARMK